MLNRDYGKKNSIPKKMADGGSAGDNAGFWERVAAGNKDQPGSEAYNRWGAGRASGDANELLRESRRSPASETPTEITARPSVPAPESAKYPDTEFGDLAGAQKRASVSPDTEFGDLEGAQNRSASDDLKAVADANDKTTPASTKVVAPVVRRRSSAGSSAAPRSMAGGIASGYSFGQGILSDAEDARRVAATTSAPASTSSSTDLDPNTTPAGEYLMDKIKKGFKSIVSGPVTHKADGGLIGGDRYYGKK